MGQQTNKVQKRRRRHDYLERQKTKAKEAVVAAAKPRPRKAPAAKKGTPAPKAEHPAAVEGSLPENPAAGAAAEMPGAEETVAE
jgi:hypothetical protein